MAAPRISKFPLVSTRERPVAKSSSRESGKNLDSEGGAASERATSSHFPKLRDKPSEEHRACSSVRDRARHSLNGATENAIVQVRETEVERMPICNTAVPRRQLHEQGQDGQREQQRAKRVALLDSSTREKLQSAKAQMNLAAIP